MSVRGKPWAYLRRKTLRPVSSVASSCRVWTRSAIAFTYGRRVQTEKRGERRSEFCRCYLIDLGDSERQGKLVSTFRSYIGLLPHCPGRKKGGVLRMSTTIYSLNHEHSPRVIKNLTYRFDGIACPRTHVCTCACAPCCEAWLREWKAAH